MKIDVPVWFIVKVVFDDGFTSYCGLPKNLLVEDKAQASRLKKDDAKRIGAKLKGDYPDDTMVIIEAEDHGDNNPAMCYVLRPDQTIWAVYEEEYSYLAESVLEILNSGNVSAGLLGCLACLFGNSPDHLTGPQVLGRIVKLQGLGMDLAEPFGGSDEDY